MTKALQQHQPPPQAPATDAAREHQMSRWGSGSDAGSCNSTLSPVDVDTALSEMSVGGGGGVGADAKSQYSSVSSGELSL